MQGLGVHKWCAAAIKPAAKLEFLMNFFPRFASSQSSATVRSQRYAANCGSTHNILPFSAAAAASARIPVLLVLLVKASLSCMLAAASTFLAADQPIQSSQIVRWSVVSRP